MRVGQVAVVADARGRRRRNRRTAAGRCAACWRRWSSSATWPIAAWPGRPSITELAAESVADQADARDGCGTCWPSKLTMPAASWPRCCSACRPSAACGRGLAVCRRCRRRRTPRCSLSSSNGTRWHRSCRPTSRLRRHQLVERLPLRVGVALAAVAVGRVPRLAADLAIGLGQQPLEQAGALLDMGRSARRRVTQSGCSSGSIRMARRQIGGADQNDAARRAEGQAQRPCRAGRARCPRCGRRPSAASSLERDQRPRGTPRDSAAASARPSVSMVTGRTSGAT